MTPSVPLSEFRVPDGRIAVTFNHHAYDPFSAHVAAEQIEHVLRTFEAEMKVTAADRKSVNKHVLLRTAVVDFAKGDLSSRADGAAGVGICLLWLALNHPHGAAQIRRCVADSLREAGKAHITIGVDARGAWATALGEGFVDTTAMLAEIPASSATFSFGIFVDEPQPFSVRN